MSFTYRAGHVGPFTVAKSTARKGQIQKFRYLSPARTDHIGQFLVVLSGEVSLHWSTLDNEGLPLKAGGSFTLDGLEIPPGVETDLTVRAAEDAVFLCIAAYGLEQKVHAARHQLMRGDFLRGARHDLMVVTGEDARVQIGDGPVVSGPRLVYGRYSEPIVKALSPVVIAACSLAG